MHCDAWRGFYRITKTDNDDDKGCFWVGIILLLLASGCMMLFSVNVGAMFLFVTFAISFFELYETFVVTG